MGDDPYRRISQKMPGKQTTSGDGTHREVKENVYGEGGIEGDGRKSIQRRDSEGRRLTPEQFQKIQGTAIKDENGAPLVVYHFTPEMQFEFVFSTRNLNESLNKQLNYGGGYSDFAKAVSQLEDVVNAAVLIEQHKKYKGTFREDRNLRNTSVLVSAFEDSKNIIPIELEIKNSAIDGGRLYMTVVMTKIEADVVEKAGSERSALSLLPASKYRLADVFAHVNPADKHFLKYVPDGFLGEEQKNAKQEAIREDEQKEKILLEKTKGNQYKVHRILTPDGKVFESPKMANAEKKTVGGVTNGGQPLGEITPTIRSAPDSSIKEDRENVKGNFQDKGKSPAKSGSFSMDEEEWTSRLQQAERVTNQREEMKHKDERATIAKKDLRKQMLQLFSIPDGQKAELGAIIDNYADRLIKNKELLYTYKKQPPIRWLLFITEVRIS